jgi:hypothetical protein
MSGPEPLPPWRPLLRSARELEARSPQARWLQLATVAADGSPRVHTLVFRGWAGSTALDGLTDGRRTSPPSWTINLKWNWVDSCPLPDPSSALGGVCKLCRPPFG